jgi:hypothetical protein
MYFGVPDPVVGLSTLRHLKSGASEMFQALAVRKQ